MIQPDKEQLEKQLNVSIKQNNLDQEVKDRQIRKHEDKIENFVALEATEDHFFDSILTVQCDEIELNQLEEMKLESKWQSRHEREYLEEQLEILANEKRELLDKEDQLFHERRKAGEINGV